MEIESDLDQKRETTGSWPAAIGVGSFLVIAMVALWLGWKRGNAEPIPFRVAGPSMAPTLLGEHYVAKCPRCHRHNVSMDASSADRRPNDVPCFLCGEPLSIDTKTIRPGDLVSVTPVPDGKGVSPQQLVAIRSKDNTSIRVKRVIATHGQKVNQVDGRITVDGRQVDDLWFDVGREPLLRSVVANESRRAVAGKAPRWIPFLKDESAWRWKDGVWSIDGKAISDVSVADWLVYHHQNVHESDTASAVMDDYEYNAFLMRRLNEVNRLLVDAKLRGSGLFAIEVAYWTTNGAVIDCGRQTTKATRRIDEPLSMRQPLAKHRPDTEQERNIDGIALRRYNSNVADARSWAWLTSSTYRGIRGDGSHSPGPRTAPVTRQSPIAIRVCFNDSDEAAKKASIELKDLTVSKPIQYRLRRSDDRSIYPLTLDEGEYFVLGDNVPVSIDSRNHGPIRCDQIVGVVTLPE